MSDDGTLATSGSVEESFRKQHVEIRRRQEVAHSSEQNPKSFERASGVAAPEFRLDSQTHFVWSASHVGMAPRAKSAEHPAVRVYGLFGSYEEALEHARVVAGADPGCSLMVSPTHEWTMLPRSPDRLAEAPAHIERVLAAYHASRQRSTEEFRENVDQQRGGTGGSGGDAENTASDPAPPDGTAAPLRLGRDAEVRDQSVVAASFVSDTTQAGGEPIFRVYAAFDNTTSGDAWARVAGDTVVDFDIDLVSTCVWLFVNDVNKRPDKISEEVYRSTELTSIISSHKRQPQQCEQFERWRNESSSES